MGLRNLDTLDQASRRRRPTAKAALEPRSTTKGREARKDLEFREGVWARDEKHSRASGRYLVRAHVDPNRRGEVAHLQFRSTHPDKKRDVRAGVLLSAEEHRVSDARTANAGGRALLHIHGTNANRKLVFVMHDSDGHVLWRRESWPPGVGR